MCCYIWIGEHKGKIILDCGTLLEKEVLGRGWGSMKKLALGEEEQGRKRETERLPKASSA